MPPFLEQYSPVWSSRPVVEERYFLVATLLPDASCLLRCMRVSHVPAHCLHLFQRLHQAGWPHERVSCLRHGHVVIGFRHARRGWSWCSFGSRGFFGFWLDQRVAVFLWHLIVDGLFLRNTDWELAARFQAASAIGWSGFSAAAVLLSLAAIGGLFQSQLLAATVAGFAPDRSAPICTFWWLQRTQRYVGSAAFIAVGVTAFWCCC